MKAIEVIVGSCLIPSGYAIYAAIQGQPLSIPWLVAIFAVCVIAYVSVLYLRSRTSAPKEREATRLNGNAAFVYLPIIIGLAFCVWAYFVGSATRRLNADVAHLKAQMLRYALPRTLTPEQTASIAEILSHETPQQVIMRVKNSDTESGNFRGDLQLAIEKGGWVVAKTEDTDNLQEGLSIGVMEPLVDPPADPDPFDRLHPKPRPGEILAQAFHKAGIQVEGSGGGSSREIKSTTIIVSIGRRRRDKYAVRPPDFERKLALDPYYQISDDDFK